MSILNKLKSLLFYLKPRKLVAQYKLFLSDEWLELSVDSIAPYVHKIVFVVSDIAWGGDRSIKGDDLGVVLERLKNKYGDKIIVVNGSWDNQFDQVSYGLNYIKKNIPEATHFLYIDSDEIYLKHQIEKLISLIRHVRYYNRAIRIQYNMYFKSIYYKIEPKKWATALVLFPIREYTEFLNERNAVSCRIIDMSELEYEHYAYIRKDDESIRKKMLAHRNSIEPILDNWYEDVWLKWTPDMTDFHPTQPELWEAAVKVEGNEIPESIKMNFSRWGLNYQ